MKEPKQGISRRKFLTNSSIIVGVASLGSIGLLDACKSTEAAIANGANTSASMPDMVSPDPSGVFPAHPGLPLAYPVSTDDPGAPPLSLIKYQPVNPAYVPGLPGLPQGKPEPNAAGAMAKKYDGVFIRQSSVVNGQVVIPPGGLYYLEDGGGMVALQGQTAYFLGHEPVYIEFDMIINVKKNVTIPAGSSVVVGGQVYYNLVGIGHETTKSQCLSVRTIAGTDWEWAFGAPVFSADQTNWWAGNTFKMLYNQGKASTISSTQLVFDWLSGVHMERILFANTKVFDGFASVGQQWTAGTRTIKLSAVDQTAGTATIQVIENGAVAFEKTLGPVNITRLIEDHDARKAIVFEYKDLTGYLVYSQAFKDGQAQLRLHADAFALNYGSDYAQDPRFSVWPVGCPSGHNFGIMWTNKAAMTIPAGGSVTGPEGYFKIAVDTIQNGEVRAWHIEDAKGNKSINLGGPGITNVDLVLGQGRVAGSDLLKDVGKASLSRYYDALVRAGT